MSRYRMIIDFLTHRLRARRWDSFHSPSLFQLFTYCCDDTIGEKDFENIERKRKEFIRSGAKIQRIDPGAGSTYKSYSNHEFISIIAKHSLSLPFQCRFMYRLMKKIKPTAVVEFGTSLGIATSYLALSAPQSEIITVEGDPELANVSNRLFQNLGLSNIKSINTSFENFIDTHLPFMKKFDFVFLDGNHKEEPLLHYYNSILPHLHSSSIVMIDDIYWSEGMKSAWSALKGMKEVTQSVDCFQFGLLFFSPDFIGKENHLIRLPLHAFRGER